MTTELIASIDDTATGAWLVRTQTSSYLLDMDGRIAIRIPSENTPEGSEWNVAHLRSDADPLPLLALIRCNVGDRMRLLLDVVGDGEITTIRDTTPVVSVERVTG